LAIKKKFMALILSLETSGNICSVALSNNYELIGTREVHNDKSHASMLTVLIEGLLKEKEVEIQSLDAIAVSKGPGSYTGLRIGVSVAKGLSYGLNVPMIAVNTLQLLSMGFLQTEYLRKFNLNSAKTLLCPMIDARRMEVYRALFNLNGLPESEILAEVINETSFDEYLVENKIIFFGNGSDKCREVIHHPNAIFVDGFNPNASSMISLAYEAYVSEDFVDTAYFEPYYLKDFVATLSQKNALAFQK
jgi:tRNA threonylcarbamoyladenosine biosynthesis protein TsaB